MDSHAENLTDAAARIKGLEGVIRYVLQNIGNVDHSTGNGENAAKYRGDMLNDIRTILKGALYDENY